MDRDRSDRVLVVCGYLAVLAAASIVVSQYVPAADTTLMSVVGAARFVAAVAAGVLGFITWFDRRFPVGDDVIDLRSESETRVAEPSKR